jgi:hypothetical protein
MNGYVFVHLEGYKSEAHLRHWMASNDQTARGLTVGSKAYKTGPMRTRGICDLMQSDPTSPFQVLT